jgi:hypothetical protein
MQDSADKSRLFTHGFGKKNIQTKLISFYMPNTQSDDSIHQCALV